MDQLFALLLSAFLGILPMTVFALLLTWFDRFEREPFPLLFAVFIWGFLVASAAALVLNTLFGASIFLLTGNQVLAIDATAVLFGPVVEESVKGFGVLIVFFFFRKEIDSVLDGIVYGGLVGFGFAAAENFIYVYSGYGLGGIIGSLAVAFLRIITVPFLHAMLTAVIGIGLAHASLGRGRYRLAAPFIGYGAAISFHAFHNLLAILGNPFLVLLSFLLDWSGFIAMALLLFYLMHREGETLRGYLEEEVRIGTITGSQCSMVSSMRSQAARKTGIPIEPSAKKKRLSDLCSRIAYEKHELEVHEKSDETLKRIRELRGEAKALSKEIL